MEEVQEKLGGREILLEFKVSFDNTYLWVVQKNGSARLIRIPVRSRELRSQVTAVLDSITDDPLATFNPEPARLLFELLLKDALHDVAEGTPLVFVPDDALQQLPFEVLVTNSSTSSGIQYLAAKYPISYYPSAGTLMVQRSVSGVRDWAFPLLAVADPVPLPENSGVGPSLLRSPVAAVTSSHSYLDDAVTRGYRFAPLPATRREVMDIAVILKIAPAPPHVLIGQATKATLLKREAGEDLSRYRFIHLATHGLLGTDVPGLNQPALLLSQDAGQDENISLLTMDEIFKLKLTAEMVVLSACQTGRGEVVPGEGIIGLTRAFLHAGARAVVVSHWNVADDATAIFMSRFYHYLLNEGMDKAQALQKARLDLLTGTVGGKALAERGIGGIAQQGKVAEAKPSAGAISGSASLSIAHPYFWAPFILVGEGK